MQVILASKSPRRKDLLVQVGMDPLVMDSYVEEVTEALSPETLVRENAARKGRKVAAAVAPDALVIAADTVVADERGILGKPKDREEAVRMLRRLSGRTHKVHTGLYVSLGGKEHLSVTTTQVTFCPLTDRLIHRYIGTGEPMDKAGAYGIQGAAALFIPHIEGSYSNVVGLPLATLFTALDELDVKLDDTTLLHARNCSRGTASGTRSASALEIASLLTSREMDLDQLARVTRIEELTHVKGLGPARASVIVAALELGRRLAEKTSRQGDRIRCPGDAARMVMERLRYEVKEHVLTLLLSAKGKVLGIEEVFVGSASQATVHPREIFETALHHHASALILVHNHPSGDPMPSRPDIRLTERLAQVGGLMDIPLADHIIIGDGIYYSFKDADQL